jgi:large subunit ribosomal protein L6
VDKHLIGQTAAQMRALRPPDSYKGKGVRYSGEVVRKKVGKAGAK